MNRLFSRFDRTRRRWDIEPLFLSGLLAIGAQSVEASEPTSTPSREQVEFFEQKIRPVLESRCLKCHGGGKSKGGLALDHRDVMRRGGDTGPAVVPGKAGESVLLEALQYGRFKMPPDGKLPDAVIADFKVWIERGAFDPRDKATTTPRAVSDWDEVYRKRLAWWSLQPVVKPNRPAVRDVAWPRTDVDRFVLGRLEATKIEPAPAADRRTLARRLGFALTGLPPRPEQVERFAADPAGDAYDRFVDALLASPHFGEHWARHWMDVVHYADTHGYEWDVPAKHAWRYRDYLTRAFNADVPFDRLVLEQIAGDVIEARVDPETGVNEALIGPMALRLGERRHGDSAQAEGVAQEAVANVIDTVSKGFLGTTVACAQCHDHKLDAVGQRDYYALAGVFMSTRWGARNIDTIDPNEATLDELGRIKAGLRKELAKRWASSSEAILERIEATKTAAAAGTFPESLPAFLHRLRTSTLGEQEFVKERERRIAANRANLTLFADFTREDGAAGWRWDGFGMRHGLAPEADLVVALEGGGVAAQFLPAGRWSRRWSPRLAGTLSSTLLDPMHLSVGFAGGGQVAETIHIDHSFHSERMRFLNQPRFGWRTLESGGFDSIQGSVDKQKRRVYLEFATKSLNNYYPPRTEYGGLKESDLAAADRSWFGATRAYRHAPGKPPLDELARFEPVFKETGDPAARVAKLILAAVDRWSRDASVSEDASLLDEALRLGWLPNDSAGSPVLSDLVERYRRIEATLRPDRTIGSAADWNEGRDERIGIRGSYTDFGDVVPRGNIRFLGGPAPRRVPQSSGRLELGEAIASPSNPLTARVYVNRVWLHLFGEGLVRTPDDFGHLGEPPVHRELLDHLAARFMADGWSTKKLVRELVMSATWQQSSVPKSNAVQADPENRLWHHMPLRRLEAEALRDALLTVSGRLDPTLFGPPLDPYRTAEDPAKRLLTGPLDGLGRRSIYLKMTLMEPPRFLAIFNQPIPRVTIGKRDVTNVPDQALALLNDPFVIAMAKHWSERALKDGSRAADERAVRMFAAALGRPPDPEEAVRLRVLLARVAEARGIGSADVLAQQPVWQDCAQALFNSKEFIYVR